MRVVDTVISREAGNSAWANVVIVGDHGESVSVRLPCPVPSGGEIGRARLAERALKLLDSLAARETAESLLVRPRGPDKERFGANSQGASASRQTFRDDE